MRQRRPNIQFVNCPRCGKKMATVTSPLCGVEALHDKFMGICGDCITPEEQIEILEGQASAILGRKVKVPG